MRTCWVPPLLRCFKQKNDVNQFAKIDPTAVLYGSRVFFVSQVFLYRLKPRAQIWLAAANALRVA